MKIGKSFALVLIATILIFVASSCVMVNHAPGIPSNLNPPDGATGVPLNTTLSWSAYDPDGDVLTYDIYFGTTGEPPLVQSGYTLNSYNPGELSPNTTYYWKIVAKDGKGATTEGPVWSFTTTAGRLLDLNIDTKLLTTGRVYYLTATYKSEADSISGKDIKFVYYDPSSGSWEDLQDAVTGKSIVKTDSNGRAIISIFPLQSTDRSFQIKAILVEDPSASGEITLKINPVSWMMLLFMVADNNLENFAIEDYQEAANTNENVSVISILDTKNLGDYFVVLDEYGKWVTVKLTATTSEDINTGDPKWLELGLYLLYEIESDYKGLILWDHGSAWLYDGSYSVLVKDGLKKFQGVGFDETSNDALTISEVRQALENVEQHFGNRELDLLGMDACLMSSIEVAYELKDTAYYFLSSAFEEPGYGWDYRFLRNISEDTDPISLGKDIIDDYYEYYSEGSHNLSLVLWDMSYMNNLASAISDLGNRLLSTLDGDLKNDLLSYYYAITHYGDSDSDYYVLVDIGDLMYMLKTYESDPQTVEDSQNVEYWLAYAKVYGGVSGEVYSTTAGLSIFFPINSSQWNSRVDDLNTLLFYTDGVVSGWGNFLYWFVQY